MVEVWTTGKCNLNCSYCFAVRKVPLDMTEEIAEATTQYLQETQVKKIEFYGGEPLLNMMPIKMMMGAHAQNRQKRSRAIGITTNGTLLKGDTLDWIRYHKASVALSFDGSKASQDMNRGGTYRTVVRNAKRAMKLGVKIGVLKVMYPLETLFDDVAEIRSLGFKNVYLNILKAYGFGYQLEDIPVFEEQYLRIIRELHNPPEFTVKDYESFAKMASRPLPLDHGCGIGRKGRTIGPDGYIYPCIDGPLLGQEYAMGSVWHGVDPVRERRIKQEAGKLNEKCLKCKFPCSPCNVVCFLHHGEFGVEPEEWFCQAIKAKYKAVSTIKPPPRSKTPPPVKTIKLEMKRLASPRGVDERQDGLHQGLRGGARDQL